MTTTTAVDPRSFQTFAEFYPFYLGEHSNRTCRRLHFVGSSMSLAMMGIAILTMNPWLALLAFVNGYA